MKQYLENGIRCVQGTDGSGFYGTDTVDEQLALQNLLHLTDEDFSKMREVEIEIQNHSDRYFDKKEKEFEKFLNGRTITQAMIEFQEEYKMENRDINFRINNDLESKKEFKELIKPLPTDKMPIIIAGGSFNSVDRDSIVSKKILNNLKKIIKKLDDKKVFFVIGHKMDAYEKAICDLIKQFNKKIEVYAIVPKLIKEEVKDRLINQNSLTGIRISTESEELRNI